ncbi:MAG TPA: hypothetical protein VJV03_18355, partial [Pyrinomonadaceae bacterium]|nr:hypothetical protein [Pyrinomonadaceae bacterium]
EIAKAMAPLKNLETTLSESLKPVVEVFGERLDKSLGLIEKQFKRLETTSADLQKAITDVKAAVGSIAEATQSLNSLIKETPKVMNRLAELEKKHERSLVKSDQLFDEHFRQADELSKALEKAIGNLSTLSDRVINEASDGIGRIEKASVGTWTAAAEELRKGVEAELEKVFEDVNRQMTDIKATLTRALEVMTYVAEACKTSITELGELAPTVSANYKISLDQVANQSSETWRNLSNQLFLDSQTQYLAYLDNVKRGTAESSEALKTAATEWYGLAVASKTVLREPVEAAMAEARNDLAQRLRSLDGNIATRITQFSGELTRLQSSTSGLVDNVRSINEDLRNWAAIAGPMTKDLRSATESISRQSETQVAIVKRFEAAADKLTRVLSRPASPPRRPDDGPTIFTPPPRKRRSWKPNTWFGGR